MAGRAVKVSFKKEPRKALTIPAQVHVEPATNQTPDAPDLTAPVLRDIAQVFHLLNSNH